MISGGCGSGCNAAMVDVERAAMRLSTCCRVDCMLLSTTVWMARRIVAILGGDSGGRGGYGRAGRGR